MIKTNFSYINKPFIMINEQPAKGTFEKTIPNGTTLFKREFYVGLAIDEGTLEPFTPTLPIDSDMRIRSYKITITRNKVTVTHVPWPYEMLIIVA